MTKILRMPRNFHLIIHVSSFEFGFLIFSWSKTSFCFYSMLRSRTGPKTLGLGGYIRSGIPQVGPENIKNWQ